MMPPMIGFLFALLIVGALASLVAVNDPDHARLTPFIGFTSLFAGTAAFILAMGLGGIGERLDVHFNTTVFGGLGFFGGYAVGGLGGALLGFKKAVRRSRRSKLP
jgi:hypothetical protein